MVIKNILGKLLQTTLIIIVVNKSHNNLEIKLRDHDIFKYNK